MAAEDYFPYNLFDTDFEDDDFGGYYRRNAIVECRYCGVGALRWREEDRGWTLVTAHGLVHKCDDNRAHAAALDDFDVLD